MNYLANRKAQKYVSDIFINPARVLALVFAIPVVILAGTWIFAIAETIHCIAHMRGAWKKERSNWWKLAKISIFSARLATSLLGATALSIVTLASSAGIIATTCASIFPIAFLFSSCFSTLHKIRGLFDHLTKPTTPGLREHLAYFPKYISKLWKKDPIHDIEKSKQMAKSFGLIGRAAVGIGGTLLMASVIILKAAFIIGLMSTPVGLGIGCVVLGLIVLQKAYKAYKHKQELNKRSIKHSSPSQSPERTRFMDNATKHLLQNDFSLSPKKSCNDNLSTADSPHSNVKNVDSVACHRNGFTTSFGKKISILPEYTNSDTQIAPSDLNRDAKHITILKNAIPR